MYYVFRMLSLMLGTVILEFGVYVVDIRLFNLGREVRFSIRQDLLG